jgi:uncharacterized CHY-type Zn-finger protein
MSGFYSSIVNATTNLLLAQTIHCEPGTEEVLQSTASSSSSMSMDEVDSSSETAVQNNSELPEMDIDLPNQPTATAGMDLHYPARLISPSLAHSASLPPASSLPPQLVRSNSVASCDDLDCGERGLRRRILAIQSDKQLSPTEKAKKIQALMTSGWTSSQAKNTTATNLLTNKSSALTLSERDTLKTYHDEVTGTLGCKHYQRGAKLQANCCGQWFTCRFCHDEVSDHQIVRAKTENMLCMHCNTAQPAGKTCTNKACGKQVAKYYCGSCKLWDNDPSKQIYRI